MNNVFVHILYTITNVVPTTKSLTEAKIDHNMSGCDIVKTLHNRYTQCACDVHVLCVFLLRRLDDALWCCQILLLTLTPRFNLSALSPPNHIAKTVSILATTDYGPRYVKYCSEPVTVK